MAILTFYASYLTMLSLGVAEELGAFWRDLALIAALLLTYSERGTGMRGHRRTGRGRILPRRIAGVTLHTLARRPLRPAPALGLGGLQARAQPIRALSDEATVFALRRRRYGAAAVTPLEDPRDEVENIFAEDAAPAA
jgi:hypothetical protein